MDEHRAEPAAAMAAEDPGGLLAPEGPCAATSSSTSLARQHGGTDGSKGDASLSARRPHFEPPGSAAGPDSVSGAPRACDAPAGRPGSAARQDAATLGARSRCTLGSSSGCRGRSGGRERLAGGTADSGTGGRSSSSRRSMRTGSTPAKSRTILCIWAVPSTARGVRRRLLPPSRRGRRRIVLSGPSLPPAISMSGVRSWANLATARGLWGSGQPLRARPLPHRPSNNRSGQFIGDINPSTTPPPKSRAPKKANKRGFRPSSTQTAPHDRFRDNRSFAGGSSSRHPYAPRGGTRSDNRALAGRNSGST